MDSNQQEQLNQKLFIASIDGNLGEIKQLVSKGANVNWKVPKELAGKEIEGYYFCENWVSFNFFGTFFHFYNKLK